MARRNGGYQPEGSIEEKPRPPRGGAAETQTNNNCANITVSLELDTSKIADQLRELAIEINYLAESLDED